MRCLKPFFAFVVLLAVGCSSNATTSVDQDELTAYTEAHAEELAEEERQMEFEEASEDEDDN